MEPLETNRKMEGIAIIIALVEWGLMQENLREAQDNKGKRNLPRIKLSYLGPPSYDFKATFP